MRTIKVFVVDDHMVVREGLKTLINAQTDMQIVGEAEDGAAAVLQIPNCHPDVVIMDISMPMLNGIKATEKLRQVCPGTKILVLSIHQDTSYLRQMLAVGASGYLVKHTVADELIQAIRSVATGGLYIDPGLAAHLVNRYVRQPTAATDLLGAALSEREHEVVLRVVQGYSNKETALQLNLSVKTVESYRARALEKLGLSSRAALVRYALEHGWLNPYPIADA